LRGRLLIGREWEFFMVGEGNEERENSEKFFMVCGGSSYSKINKNKGFICYN